MTDNELLDSLLEGTAATLDIPESMHDRAVTEYGAIARFLAATCLAPGDIQIYPQGSFRLGTVVLPTAFGDQYDIDLVFLRAIPKDSTTQADLKRVAGELLADYVKSQEDSPDCPKLIERGRCWTLEYASLKFHLDILPTVPDDDLPPSGVLLTDRDLFRWQHSNPIGYANWFRQRETETQYRKAVTAAAQQRGWTIEKVPEHLVRTPLQRLVQIVKRHRDLYFSEDLDNRPPSILLTTLIAAAYDGEDSLLAAMQGVLARIPGHIEDRNGTLWVENPAHPGENFADKWNLAPERRTAFIAWIQAITGEINGARRGGGLDVVTASLGRILGESPVKTAAANLGEQMKALTAAGLIATAGPSITRTAPTARPIPKHTFHGGDE
jgi:hypothetical protein